MALDSKYICTSDLESVFLDKLTGLPLSGGYVEFYIDQGGSSNVAKQVYTTTGSPPTSFVPLGTVVGSKIIVTLDSIGQYSDGATSKVLYYYPYDADGNLQLYAIKVYSSDNILQFTREAWPPLASNLAPTPGTDSGVQNYIPNGQFLAHNNNFINDTTTETGITISEIAQGGWSFKHTTVGTGVYTVTFNTENFATGLLDAPPFSVNIVCSAFNSSDVIRDLVIQWPDVNTFSRKGLTIEFNLFFKGRLNTGSSETFNVYLIQNYGSGGSTTDVSAPTSITLTNSYTTPFNVPILMPDNSGKTIGTGSFVAIAIRGPSNTYSARFTDFALTLGATNLTSFPLMTNDEQLSRGVAGWMPTPNPDGSDLYLPLILTNKGMKFDDSQIGTIIGKTQTSTQPVTQEYNELFMDGSVYLASGYSAIGIPYQRLMNYLLRNCPAGTVGSNVITANSAPMYGTGPAFVVIFLHADPTKFNLNFNTAGANVAGNGTSGFTHTSADPLYVYTVTAVPTAGTYFTFTPVTGGLVYNVWYKVDNAGSAPAVPTGANIEVDIASTDTIAAVILATQKAVNRRQFMVLNAQGYFWRGIDTFGTVDKGPIRTVPGLANLSGAFQGSVEAEAVIDHEHLSSSAQFIISAGGASFAGAGAATTTPTTGGVNPPNDGGTETRPVNLGLNWFIKY